MPKIHPNDGGNCADHVLIDDQLCKASLTTLTVWKKSLVFNCNGFTVYDSTGNLAFRVDNYASNIKDGVILMDAAGNAFLTMRRKRLSIQNEWQGFLGDKLNGQKPMFSLRRPSTLLPTKVLAEVFIGSAKQKKQSDYHIEGSYSKRSFTIYSNSRSIVAEVRRKQATSEIMLGADVFNLVVQPGYDQAFIMGLIITLDQIISSS
eukprot:Gb_02523 [translate_table: standard]